MERTRKPVAFLDTHVALWLFDRNEEKISARAKELLANAQLRISPIVLLEIQYLYEIKRSRHTSTAIFQWLERHLEVQLSETPFLPVIHSALSLRWTRDSFDRLIVAESELYAIPLVTKDRHIRKHYKRAIW